MNIDNRIKRRLRQADGESLVTDYTVLSPATHIADPVDRASIVEQLLTQFDPAFEGEIPEPLYLYGPPGSGKSAIVTALFRKLSEIPSETRPVIHTSTRVEPSQQPVFSYIDSRHVDTEFAFFRTILDRVSADTIPKRGVSAAALRDELHEWSEEGPPVVVAVDHLDDHEQTLTLEQIITWIEPFSETIGLVGIGRTLPELPVFESAAGEVCQFTPYREDKVADILTRRASYGMGDDALNFEAAEPIVEWSAGNAHDALAALFVAAERAEQRNSDRIHRDDSNEAVETLADDTISLDRVCALSENRQAVLRELIAVAPESRESVAKAATTVTESLSRDLSEGTVKRFIYEAAEDGLLDRFERNDPSDVGRTASRVEPAFPVPVFRRLYDVENGRQTEESAEATVEPAE